MPSQSDLIGNHPEAPNQFGCWLSCNDVQVTPNKCHRSLTQVIRSDDPVLIEWLAKHLIKHHYTEKRLSKLREKYGQLRFPEYAERNRKLPRLDKTKKGNAIEILLVEYLNSSLNKEFIKILKLQYNPNVDQSMKGDDVLMIDLTNQNGQDQVKMYLGETKFRAAPAKAVIDEIMESLNKDKKPLSYSYLMDEIGKYPENNDLYEKLDRIIIDEIKGRGNLIYTGLLLSNTDTFEIVEKHLNCDNPSFVFISIGIINAETLILKAYEKAEELILNGEI
jgi:hypothetical protein